MPLLDALVSRGQFVMTGVKKIVQHAEQIEINEARAVIQQERLVRQHHFKRNQSFFELLEQIFLLRAPLVNAAATELAFLVAEEGQLPGARNEFLPVNIVESEGRALNFVFDVAPKDGLHPAPLRREQAEFHFLVEIFGNDLRIVGQFDNHALAVLDDGHAVVALPGQFPDQCAVGIGNVDAFEASAGKFKNTPLNQAVGTPRKLNQFNHVKTRSINLDNECRSARAG